MAHAWVQMFDSEYEAFKAYAELYPNDTTLLVDTFDVYDLMLKYIEAVRPGRSDKRKMRPKSFVCFTYRVAA